MISHAEWYLDEWNVWNFLTHDPMGNPVHAFIQKRPPYCDRGHYSFNVDARLNLDGADSFPRYYMDLDTAMLEAVKWLNWRMYKIPNDDQFDVTVEIV
jgi:hypothetical protein